MYGMYFARQAIDKQNECLLVEGYTDVLSLHQAGIENVVASGGTSLTQDQLRLIKKYTSNLTIIYDGDSAGIKAALRGLDMALAEGLYVKLVLIPDNEDPDSYVQKLGSTAFQTFIEKEKKDFILFQLEVMLKQAGSDTQKRSETVNQIAETLSHLNKVEDFTRQQDYIKTCAALLRIDEEGLTHLVNKYKRDRLTKQEKTSLQVPVVAEEDVEANTLNLLLGDEAQERGIIRCLLEYGLNNWTTEKTVADYIFEELEHFHIENPLLEKISNIYQKLYKEGLQPNVKMFSYYPEKDISDEVIAIMASPYELSENWDRIMEGANINNRDVSVEDVTLSMSYFKLHKLKKMLQQNQQDMQQAADAETLNRCLSIHKTLKDIEQEITKLLGTVISK
jgi:DNA primase